MGRLSTHVLDTANGKPAAGMRIELRVPDRDVGGRFLTNVDGRTDGPVVDGVPLSIGTYRFDFYVGDYFRSVGSADAGKFLDVVPIVFVVSDPHANYHVPLLVSPWAYSTYRGS